MSAEASRGCEIVLKTDRLLLRARRVSDAAILREMWAERDPRVPPHRRIGEHGRPTVADLEEVIRAGQSPAGGLLAIEHKGAGDVIGYCGLVDSGHGVQEPELAFELLRRFWGQGYATEASRAVLDWAGSTGYQRLWATVWLWNTASQRVLAKSGFTEVDREETTYGTRLVTARRL